MTPAAGAAAGAFAHAQRAALQRGRPEGGCDGRQAVECARSIEGSIRTGEQYEVVDTRTGEVVSAHADLRRAKRAADRRDAEYGAVRYVVRRAVGES
jgi:hypothetical protein